ncbi:MAG: hypothetical protein ABIV11_03255 [Gemmatimonadaceae bacterium]
MTKLSSILLTVSAFAMSACGQLPHNGSGSRESDWAAIVRLEDQAKAIAKTSGCSSVSECRTAPVGNRACGGPRYYIAYCAATTDSVALFRKLDEVASAEKAYNRKYQLVSTCEFRMPPPLTLSGGECRAVSQ